MGKKKRILFGIAALLAAAIAACLWYARPLTIEEIYPTLDLEECVGVQVDYHIHSEEREQLLLEGDSLSPLLELFQGRKFRRSPFFWLPRVNKVHRLQEGDFTWYIDFAYKDVPMTDFSTASGYLLHFENFYGELEMRVDETTRTVRTADQEQWLEDVLACLETVEPSTSAEFQETLYNS